MYYRHRSTFVIFLCLLLLLPLLPSPVLAKVALLTAGKDVYLTENGQKYLLISHGTWVPPQPLCDFPLAGGYRLLLPGGRVESDGLEVWKGKKRVARINYNTVVNDWLADEKRWNSHQEVNELRYMQKNGGFAGQITNVTPVGESALALFSWYSKGASWLPLAEQFLVRIAVKPTVTITLLRRLVIEPSNLFKTGFYPPAPSLVAVGKRIFLLSRPNRQPSGEPPPGAMSTLEILSPAGKSAGIFTRIPASLALFGTVGNRWMIFGKMEKSTRDSMQMLDLSFKRRVVLRGPWKDARKDGNYFFPQQGNRFLFTEDASDGTSVTYVISLPGGHIIKITNPNGSIDPALWRNYVIRYTPTDDHHYTLTVFDAATGRKILQRTGYSRNSS